VLPFRAGLRAEVREPQLQARLEARSERARNTAGALHAAGARIVAGADADGLPGGLPRELAALVAAGLSPADALRAATSQAAAVLGLENELGQVRPGLRADLLLLAADPLADIDNVGRIRAVIQGGRLIDRAALLRADPGG
jgi:imidazolonepropionase-like amidohydrolase